MPLEVKLNREAFFFCIECEEGLGRVRYVGNTTSQSPSALFLRLDEDNPRTCKFSHMREDARAGSP